MKRLFFIIALSICLAGESWAEDQITPKAQAFLDSADTTQIVRLTMSECLKMALEKNSEIKVKKIEPEIKRQELRMKRAVYEPTFMADLSYLTSETRSAAPVLTGQSTDKSKIGVWDFGLGGVLPFGTTYDIGFLNSKTRSNSRLQVLNPEFGVTGSVALTQPVLKGFFIDSYRADIRIAKNNREISQEDFIDKVMSVITGVESAYFDCILTQGIYEIGKISLKNAQELYSITKERYDKGIASSVDLLETEAGLARREEALLEFEGRLKTSEDSLKLITNLVDDPKLWDADLAAIERPEFKVEPVDKASSINDAFAYRPDYKMAKIGLKNKDVKLKLSWDNLMPQVDLIGSFELNGLDGSYHGAANQVFDRADHDTWSAGVQISMPFGYEEEMADLTANRLEKEKALIDFARLEQKIILEVRDAVRWVDINSRKVVAADKTKQAEEKTYNAAKERFKSGLVSTKDMLDYQEDYESAQIEYLRAIIDYNKSIDDLDKKTGTTLVKNNIEMET